MYADYADEAYDDEDYAEEAFDIVNDNEGAYDDEEELDDDDSYFDAETMSALQRLMRQQKKMDADYYDEY